MKRVRAAAALLALSAASYAWAQAPEALLGTPLPVAGAGKAAGREPAALPLGRSAASSGPVSRYAGALGALAPEGRAATRGAQEMRVYQGASPAVVLVIGKKVFGSGALISTDGLIVTNLHVVGGQEEVGVIFKPRAEGAAVADAAVHRGKVIRRDEVADLALLQVGEVPSHVQPLAVGSASAVQVGSDVHAIGHPTGEAWTYTRGIVSQIRRDYEWLSEDKIPHVATVIQTQTPLNPGNSGGPLIDDNLQLIGVNSFGGDGEGLNYAVSADEVRALLARKEDRLAAPARKQAAAKPCEHEVVDQRPMKEMKGTEYLVDSDCDGEGDYMMMEPEDRREPFTVLTDDDGDGKIARSWWTRTATVTRTSPITTPTVTGSPTWRANSGAGRASPTATSGSRGRRRQLLRGQLSRQVR